MIDFVDGFHGFSRGGGHGGGGHGGGFRPGHYRAHGYPNPYPSPALPNYDGTGDFIRAVLEAYKTGRVSAGIDHASPAQRAAYSELGRRISAWVKDPAGLHGTPTWWARGRRLDAEVHAATGISSGFSGGSDEGFAGFGDVSFLDAFLATIGIVGPLASDLTNDVTSSSDPSTVVGNSQATLTDALNAGTINGDQYNQALAQITAQAQAGTIGGNIAAAGQGILSGAEGVAVVAGLVGVALYFGPSLLGHTVRSSASEIGRGTGRKKKR